MKTRNAFFKAMGAMTFCIAVAQSPAMGQGKVPTNEPFTIRIAQQPAKWSLEWFVASEKGWWEEVGLKPQISTFASGALVIAAGASGSWDVGASGNIPSVLGASKYGLQTIALIDGESAAIAMVSPKNKAEQFLKDPASMKGQTIPVTFNSTGHWQATECLSKKFGLKQGEYRLVNLSPPDINAAMVSGKYDAAGIWAPNTYILEETIDAKVLCSGADLNLPIHSYIFVTPAFAEKNPEMVAKFLAVFMRAVAWEQKNPKEAEDYLKKFYDKIGVKIEDKYLTREMKDRPVYDLEEQLKVFSPGQSGQSEISKWWNQVGDFMVSVKMIKGTPDPQKNITNKYLKMIQDDPKLRAFVAEGAK
ncbi:MAG: ABC transporter substrate-binding protein [Comamonas sp.]